MKRMTQIANELRDNARMFSATKLQEELLQLTPVFKEGNVTFYADDVVDSLLDKFRVNKRKLALIQNTVVPEPIIVVEPTYSRLERMEKMLENISGYLDLQVPA